MALRAITTLILALAAIFSGCTGEPGKEERQDDQAAQPVGTSMHGNMTVPVIENATLWTSCQGWEAAMYWPGPDAPAPNPPAWAPDEFFPGKSIVLQGWECERVALGSLERGPIRMMIEYTNNFVVPDGCAIAQDTIVIWSVHSWGVDDPGLRDALVARGAPAYLMEVEVTGQAAAGTGMYTWAWGPANQTKSTVTTVDSGQTTELDRLPDRFLWANGTSITGLDISYSGLGTLLGPHASHGDLQPPMLLAAAYPQFVSRGQWYPTADMAGIWLTWADHQCTDSSFL